MKQVRWPALSDCGSEWICVLSWLRSASSGSYVGCAALRSCESYCQMCDYQMGKDLGYEDNGGDTATAGPTSDVRVDRIIEIRERITNGTYRIRAADLAQKLVEGQCMLHREEAGNGLTTSKKLVCMVKAYS